jgi:tRNA U55 pseudouridine synthase TruB
LDIECGGGFYVRSVISDIAKKLNGAACMIALVRTKHGQFELSDCLKENEWTFNNICENISISSKKIGINSGTLKPSFVFDESYLSNLITNVNTKPTVKKIKKEFLESVEIK